MTWPTRLPEDEPRRAYTDIELRQRRQTRSTAVHEASILWGGRWRDTKIKDRTVLDSEYEGEVKWGTVPNRFGRFVHLVTTRRSQVEVIEERGANGEPLSLTCGKHNVWNVNGAILKILRIWKRVEWRDKPGQGKPDAEVVVRKLGAQDVPGSPPSMVAKRAAPKVEQVPRRDAVKEFHALLHPASKGIHVEASRPGKGSIRFSSVDSREAVELFKNWLREDSEADVEQVFDRMPRSAIAQAVRELGRNQWVSTPEIVRAATNQKISWSDARYPEFAQRISADRQEEKGWFHQLAEQGIELQEQHFRIRSPSGKTVRVKHYRYEA
ncbi:MAG: hypothetical protein LC623_01245 [Halobacteriales archaeon]|nr:hypothetical protein [Halobacteriales archaeon]